MTQIVFDCVALGESDQAHANAITARTAADAVVTALQAALEQASEAPAADARAGR